MGGIFNYDSPLMSGLGKIADLAILNFLTLLFCIPIVTIGASLTACHYVALKIRRGEGYVFKNFWKSFKENLIQSTILWLIFVAFVIMTVMSYAMAMTNMGEKMGPIICTILFVGGLFAAMTSVWALPLQSKFINNIGTTIKNAFLMAFRYLFRTMLMLIISIIPIVLVLVVSFQWYSLLMLFGISVPIYLCALLYDKKFQEIEDMIMDRQLEEQQNANSDCLSC